MTTVAHKVLDDFMRLSAEEQLQVRDRVISLTEARQQEALDRLYGASSGAGLLDKMLADRAEERSRG